MTDPRQTDPRYSDRPDPIPSSDENSGVWGWVAGLAILALIAFVVVAGWNSEKNTASTSGPSAPVTANAPRSPPSTTGAGSTAPQPMKPATPAPSSRGTQ